MFGAHKSAKTSSQKQNLDALVKSLFQDEYLLLKRQDSRGPTPVSPSLSSSKSHSPLSPSSSSSSESRFWDSMIRSATEEREPFI